MYFHYSTTAVVRTMTRVGSSIFQYTNNPILRPYIFLSLIIWKSWDGQGSVFCLVIRWVRKALKSAEVWSHECKSGKTNPVRDKTVQSSGTFNECTQLWQSLHRHGNWRLLPELQNHTPCVWPRHNHWRSISTTWYHGYRYGTQNQGISHWWLWFHDMFEACSPCCVCYFHNQAQEHTTESMVHHIRITIKQRQWFNFQACISLHLVLCAFVYHWCNISYNSFETTSFAKRDRSFYL